jgi:hypothetical protein
MSNLYLQGARRLVVAAALWWVGSAWGASVPAVNFPGNVSTCSQATVEPASLGVNPLLAAQDGRVTFDPGNGGPIPSGTYTSSDGVKFDITVTQDGGGGFHIDWTATYNGAPFGIDAVVVKGGPSFNAYIYDPELNPPGPETDASSDTDLVPPQGFSHMFFCYDYHLVVNKTANPHFTRTHNWTLSKSVSPSSLNLFNGDTGGVTYTVSAQEDVTPAVDSFFTISGTVTISNPWPFAANIATITDTLSDGAPVALTCAVGTLAAGTSESCDYSQAIATTIQAGDSRTNTVVVTTTPGGQVNGGAASATATYSTPTTENHTSVTISDSDSGAGGPWTFTQSNSVNYGKTFDCTGQTKSTYSYDFGNTVTDQYGDSASANVHVDCYSLAVSKNATTSYQRQWVWNIAKSYTGPQLTVDTDNNGTPDALLLATGQSVNLSYNVVVSAQSTDSAWGVAGQITISNNNPTRDASLTGVVDNLPTAIGMNVDCHGATTVPHGGSITCDYSASLPSASGQTNTATATQQNYHYDIVAGAEVATPTGTKDYSGTAPVSFGAPTTLIDHCVNVTDLFNGGVSSTLATNLCASAGTFSTTIPYSVSFTWDPSLGTCKTIQVPNVATFQSTTSPTTGNSSASINIINESCALGCTLTQGYWKTHSIYGPAAHPDPTWADVGGPDAKFYTASHYFGQSWLQTFWTAPQGGNAFYILAHQFEAAVLNGFNGASQPPQVQDAVNTAAGLFSTNAYTPAYIGGLKSNNALRQQYISLAALLDMYNSGKYPGGPLHCTEDSTSSSAP